MYKNNKKLEKTLFWNSLFFIIVVVLGPPPKSITQNIVLNGFRQSGIMPPRSPNNWALPVNAKKHGLDEKCRNYKSLWNDLMVSHI